MTKRKGFTLIELLVVIAIIALLMSILMPALAKVRNQAKTVVCQSNQKQLILAASMYVDSHNGTFNDGWRPNSVDSPWHMDFLPYYEDIKLLLCPMANKPSPPGTYYGRTFKAYNYEGIAAIAALGLGPEDSYGTGSYGINEWVSNSPAGTLGLPASYWWRSPNVKGTNRIPLLLDCTAAGPFVKLPYDASPLAPPLYRDQDPATLNQIGGYCIDRHSSYINGTFLDFSSRKVGLKEVWTFKWFRGDSNKDNPYVISYWGSGSTARADCAEHWDSKAEWMKNMKEY